MSLPAVDTNLPDESDSLLQALCRVGVQQARAFGAYGAVSVTDTSVNTGKYCAIHVVADCVFTTLTGSVSGTRTGITFPAGFIIYGIFTVVTLASGKVLLYKSE